MMQRDLAISRDSSTSLELQNNDVYLNHIVHTKEQPEEGRRRELVLVKIDHLLKEWVRREVIKKGKGKLAAQEAGGRMFTSGSYRMGVHGPGSDIDVILVVPQFITSADFFESLYAILKAHPDTSEIRRTPGARQPIMSLTFMQICLDMQLATLRQSSVSSNIDICAVGTLRGLDPTTRRTLSGPAVAECVLRAVPQVRTFRECLRGVKLWATSRGVTSSRMAYMGGVALAILVARVCQLYPNLCSAGLLHKFFSMYSGWFRADTTQHRNQPIYLTASLTVSEPELRNISWDSASKMRDAGDILPIITPAVPYQNTCAQVSRSTLRIICEEFVRGANILDRGMQEAQNAATSDLSAKQIYEASFKELCLDTEFFARYPYFLSVNVSSADMQDFKDYESGVESRMGVLLRSLEKNNADLTCHLMPRMFMHPEAEPPELATGADRPNTTKIYTACIFIGFLVEQKNAQIDIRKAIQDFKDSLNSLVESMKAGNNTKLVLLPQKKIPTWIITEEERRKLRHQYKTQSKPIVLPIENIEKNGTDSATGHEEVSSKRMKVSHVERMKEDKLVTENESESLKARRNSDMLTPENKIVTENESETLQRREEPDVPTPQYPEKPISKEVEEPESLPGTMSDQEIEDVLASMYN